jgi:hypothetical protein
MAAVRKKKFLHDGAIAAGEAQRTDFAKLVRQVCGGVVLDRRHRGADVGLGGRVVRPILELQVRRDRDREQDAEDDDDNEELDQGEALLGAEARLEARNHLTCFSLSRMADGTPLIGRGCSIELAPLGGFASPT